MEKGLAEVILGYKRDRQVGPVVLLGVGGVLAEIYKDFAVRLAPVSEREARKMIDEVKGLAVIRGYRGMPHGDCGALAKAVSSFSQLAHVADDRGSRDQSADGEARRRGRRRGRWPDRARLHIDDSEH